MNVTIGALADWIILHRRGKAFFNYTKNQIIQQLINCVENNMLYQVNDGDKILAVVCGTRDASTKTVHVNDILCIRRGLLKLFIQKFTVMYPGYNLTANRNGKFVRYNTPRLTQCFVKGNQ